MIIQLFKSFFLKQNIFNYFLFFFVFFISIVVSKFSLWHDINSFYTNLLRNYENQIFLKDYFCHFFPLQFYFLSPILNFINLEKFIVLFSIILNFLFAFQFTYYTKKILQSKIKFFNLFIIVSFFFIPFGIGAAHHNELAIYFCVIGFLIAINNLDRFNYIALSFLTLGLTIKYSIALPIYGAIFLSFTILLFTDFSKNHLILFLKYIFSIAFLFLLIIYFYIVSADISIKDFFSYLFFDTMTLSESRFTIGSFLFFNLFENILNFFFDFDGIKSLPIGSLLQLPIVLSYFIFIFIVIIKRKNLSFKEKIFFYFLIFASIFLFVSLGRDWNHKFILLIITNYFLFYYFFSFEKKISNNQNNFVILIIFAIYSLVPINERIPLKKIFQNNEFKKEDYFVTVFENSPTITLKRSKFEDANGINNLNDQYIKISNYLIKQDKLSLFFVDDISTIFSTLLKKAPNDSSCFHVWFLTPPLNKNVKKKWIEVFLKNYKNTENAKLVICNTDEGKLCLYSPVFDDEKFVAIEPTDINDNIFIKELISNSKVVFNTKNFYIYEKK